MPELIAYDTETTGLDRRRHEVFAFSTMNEAEKVEVHRLDKSALRRAKGLTYLERVWDSEISIPIMHNAKFDIGMTEKLLGRRLREQPFHDTIMQSRIMMNSHPSHGLKELCWELAGIPTDDEDAVKSHVIRGNWQTVPELLMNRYQHLDAYRTMLLHQFFYPKIERDPKLKEVYQYELDVIPVTMDMEDAGVMINPRACLSLKEQLLSDAMLEEEKVQRHFCDDSIRLGKPAHIIDLLYNKLKFPVESKTATGKPCTDKEVLNELRMNHPNNWILDAIMKYRSWTRGSTMMQNYIDAADDAYLIHPNINTAGASTGRQSCSNPNLQNVQKSQSITTPFPVPARKIFRPRPGYINIHIDYSGIEMKLLVMYCKEPELIKTIREGGDVHLLGANIFYGDRFVKADEKEKKALRSAAKNANFALCYGANFERLATTLNIPVDEARKRLMIYRQRVPLLCGLCNTISQQVRHTGFVTSTFGRRLYVPRNKAYIGVNYLIQGTAAEILKRAEVKVWRFLKHLGEDIRMILPIHDEIVFEMNRKLLPKSREILDEIRRLMVDFNLDVPLETECSYTTSTWEAAMKGYPDGNG